MYRTFLAAMLIAAAPLAAAPNDDDMPAAVSAPAGAMLAAPFIAEFEPAVSRVEVRLSYAGAGAACVAELREVSPDNLPGATVAKSQIELAAGQEDYSFAFMPAAALVAGQQYFLALHADDAFAWLGQADADALILASQDGGLVWSESMGMRASMQLVAVQPPALEIIGQPADVSILPGESATLYVEVVGQDPMYFTWFEGEAGDESAPVQGAAEPFLVVTPAQNTQYWVRVTNDAGESVESAAAKVNLVEDAAIQPPVAPTMTGGAFSMAATSTLAQAVIGAISDPSIGGNVMQEAGPAGLRVFDLRMAGGLVYGSFRADAALAEGVYVLSFVLRTETGFKLSFEVTAVITPNSAPTLAGVEDQAMDVNSDLWVSLYAQDAEQSFKQLAFSVEFDNSALLDIDAGIQFFPASQGMLVMPRPGHVGKARITVTVTDHGGLNARVEFTLVVGDEAKHLWIAQIEDQVVMADGTTLTLPIELINYDGAAETMPRAYAVDQAILPGSALQISGAQDGYYLSITGEVNNLGQTMVIVKASDGDVTATMAFLVTVADGMVLSGTAPGAVQATDEFDGGCSAGAGGGLAALALAALPVLSRRRRK